MNSLLEYFSHAWYQDRSACEIYVRVCIGSPPHAGDTVLLQTGGREIPLTIVGARWQDEESGGVLVLHVAPDQKKVVELLYLGVSIRSR